MTCTGHMSVTSNPVSIVAQFLGRKGVVIILCGELNKVWSLWLAGLRAARVCRWLLQSSRDGSRGDDYGRHDLNIITSHPRHATVHVPPHLTMPSHTPSVSVLMACLYITAVLQCTCASRRGH